MKKYMIASLMISSLVSLSAFAKEDAAKTGPMAPTPADMAVSSTETQTNKASSTKAQVQVEQSKAKGHQKLEDKTKTSSASAKAKEAGHPVTLPIEENK